MLQEHERLSLDQVAQQIRVACEKVDSLTHSIQIPNQREKLSEAFEDLFLLLEQFRFSEKDLRVKDDQQLSVQEIVMIERERYQELFEVYLSLSRKLMDDFARLDAITRKHLK